jgi:hypothetical protein
LFAVPPWLFVARDSSLASKQRRGVAAEVGITSAIM